MEDKNYVNDKLTIDELFHRSNKYKDSKEFVKFFNFIAGFSHYSRYNTMLVYLQNENVTFFGGTSFWKKKYNRIISEDARPYVILAPNGPVMMVYDVMETEGKESPHDFLKTGLGRKPFEVTGSLKPGILNSALAEAENLGIRILRKPQSYFRGGHITTIFAGKLEIVINANSTAEESFSTLLHELAHLFLGHTGHKELTRSNSQKTEKLSIRKVSRNVEELEAETVSFLLSNRLGLRTSSAEYISGYIKSKNDLQEFSYETVIKTADRIEKIFLQNPIKTNIM